MSAIDSSTVFGKLGDRLPEDVFLAKIGAAKSRIDRIVAIHASGKNTDPETDPRDVAEAIKLYNYLLNNPLFFNKKLVRSHLAALPISLAAKPVLIDRDVAIHLDVNYFFKDYSALVPANVADSFKVVPVAVFRDNKEEAWRDKLLTHFKNKEVSLSDKEFKNGVYTSCVGIALVWGGSVTPCPYDDQPRIIDQPRHRCEVCTKEFTKARTKMRKTGRTSVKASKTIDDLLSLLD